MFKKVNWVWTSYFVFYFFVSCLNLLYFFMPDSPVNMYYHVAMAFDFHFFGVYFLNLVAVVLTVTSLIPLYFYIFHVDFGDRRFWQCFFFFRLAFDVMGRNYESNLFKALFFENHSLGIKALLASIILTIPSYMALYDYAFGRKKI
jgi:hypothetical protein